MGNCCDRKSKEKTKYPTRNAKDKINRIFNILFSFLKNKNQDVEEIECFIPNKEYEDFLECMEYYENQLYFLNKITKVSGTIKLGLPKDVFDYLDEIFSIISKSIYGNLDDMNNIKFQIVGKIIDLSNTFYYNDFPRRKRLIKNLRNMFVFRDYTFWRKYLEYLINEEIKKQTKKQIDKLTEEEEQNLKTKFAYIPMASIALIMREFKFDKNSLKHFMDEFIEKYKISEENKNYVYSCMEEKLNVWIK